MSEHTAETDTVNPAASNLTEADAAIREIDDAASVADSHLLALQSVIPGLAQATPVSSGAGESAGKDETKTRGDRAAYFAERAERQKKRGRDQLTRTYVGALSMKKQLTVNDVNIASSAERFVGVIDLAFYTVQRRGVPILGASATEDLLTQLTEMSQKYCESAASARAQAESLTVSAKAAVFDDWLEPTYTKSALEVEVHVKSPACAGLVKAVMDWDKAINDLSVLQWNGKADAAQCAQIKSEERRALAGIFKFAIRALQGLRNKSKPPEQARSAASPSTEVSLAEA